MPMIPAPRRASLISSSLNGLTIAVTRWITSSPWCSNRFLVGWDGCAPWHTGAAQWLSGPEQGRVADTLAELHVVGGGAVLVDVETLELAVLLEPQVPRTIEGPDGELQQLTAT